MSKIEISYDDLQDILGLIKKLDEIENNDQFFDKIPQPYTIGKCPEPERWEDKGIQDKLL